MRRGGWKSLRKSRKKARSSYNFQQGGASSSQDIARSVTAPGPQKRKGEDIEEREVKGQVEGGGLVWWVPKAPTGDETDEEMEPPVHPAKEDRRIGEVFVPDVDCRQPTSACEKAPPGECRIQASSYTRDLLRGGVHSATPSPHTRGTCTQKCGQRTSVTGEQWDSRAA